MVQVAYDPSTTWRAYGFVQDTLSADGNREENSRVGAGGSYSLTERLKLDAEVSAGDLGPGGRIGSNFLYSERTNLYLNYSLENERTDNGLARASRQPGLGRQDAVLRQHQHVRRGALPGNRFTHRPDARNGPEPGGE